jgi:hypothetical protein
LHNSQAKLPPIRGSGASLKWKDQADTITVSLEEYVGRWIFLNTSYRDFSQARGGQADLDDGAEEIEGCEQTKGTLAKLGRTVQHDYGFYDSCGNSSLSCSPSSGVDLSPTETILLSYFVRWICPQCSHSTENHNPYLMLLTPMSFSSAPLRSAVLAVAANQLRLVNDRRFEKEAWTYKMKAIRGIREAIQSQPDAMQTELVATVLMLCFYDVSINN